MSSRAIENIVETIFDIRDNPKNYDNEELLNFVNELAETIHEDPINTYKSFILVLKDKRRALGYCPECGSPLSTATRKEYHRELAEFSNETPYEKFYFQFCHMCGWNIDNNE